MCKCLDDYSEDSPVVTCQTSPSSSTSIEVLDTIFHINQTDCDTLYGWASLNDLIRFRLRKGWITAELISSSKDIIIPPQYEIVSPIFRVFTSPGAHVSLDVSHCVQSVKANNSSQLSFAVAQIHSSTVYPLGLKSYGMSKFSFKENYGTLKIQQKSLEPCCCLIGCIVLHQVDAIHSSSTPSPITSIPSPLPIKYTYSVFYQLMDCGIEVDFRHWKVHILAHKDLLCFHVSLLNADRATRMYCINPNQNLCNTKFIIVCNIMFRKK